MQMFALPAKMSEPPNIFLPTVTRFISAITPTMNHDQYMYVTMGHSTTSPRLMRIPLVRGLEKITKYSIDANDFLFSD